MRLPVHTRVPTSVRNPSIEYTTGVSTVLAQDAEPILAQLRRAEIELLYAVADISHLGALAHYPEMEIALTALSAAAAKLESAALSADDQNRPPSN